MGCVVQQDRAEDGLLGVDVGGQSGVETRQVGGGGHRESLRWKDAAVLGRKTRMKVENRPHPGEVQDRESSTRRPLGVPGKVPAYCEITIADVLVNVNVL